MTNFFICVFVLGALLSFYVSNKQEVDIVSKKLDDLFKRPSKKK